MSVIDKARAAIKGRKKRLLMPEADDSRIAEAADLLRDQELAEIMFVDQRHPPRQHHVEALMARRGKLTVPMAMRLLERPLYHAAALLASGEADAMLAGATSPTARVIEAAMMAIGLKPGISIPSSFFLMQFGNRHLFFADCAVNPQPTASELADIAIETATSARRLMNEPPRVALLSFSTHGSAHHPDAEKATEAAHLAKMRAPDLLVDGELQVDAALDPEIALRKLRHKSEVAGCANVLIFPDLDAGNIAYKLMQQLAGAQATGPILQGFVRPVSDLSRGASIADVVSTATLLLSMA
jgi:phosphate acetyltransferase